MNCGIKVSEVDRKKVTKGGLVRKRRRVVGNERVLELQRPLSVTSGIALCVEKPSGVLLITIARARTLRIGALAREYVRATIIATCRRRARCRRRRRRRRRSKGFHYPLISLRGSPVCTSDDRDNAVTLTITISLR